MNSIKPGNYYWPVTGEVAQQMAKNAGCCNCGGIYGDPVVAWLEVPDDSETPRLWYLCLTHLIARIN